jgi:ferredoxin
MWNELQNAAANALACPEVIGERCVHSLMEKASCRACVDVCPRDAWIFNEDMLGIDEDRCDGCDLCAPACPQGAIEGRFSPSLKATNWGSAAFAACEHAGVPSRTDGFMPCLHAIGMSNLLQLRREGTGVLVTSRGDCEHCARGGVKRLEKTLEDTNRLLVSRGLKPLKHRSLGGDVWNKTFGRICELASSRSLDRRAFFRNAVRVSRDRVETAIEDLANRFVPPGMLLEGDAVEPLFPYVPRIDPKRCNGCDACVRLCPHEAIELEADVQGAPAFLIRAERCSGCGICADVCEWDAVVVKTIDPAIGIRISLRARRCRTCGTGFHVPIAGADGDNLCWVCRKTDHHRNLYQVLD